MKRNLFVILLIISQFLFIAGTLDAWQRGVRVRAGGGELFETEPKNIVTATFEVTGASDEELEFVSDVKLPEGWKLIIPSFPFRLAPNGTEIRLVSFFVPQTALAGQYEIIYRVNSVKYPSISDFAKNYVAVLPVTRLKIKVLEAPEYAVAGEEYQVSFMILNESNVETAVGIKIDSGENLPFIVDDERFQLAPGKLKTVKVAVKTDAKLEKILKHRLQLTACALEDEKIKAQAASWVEIIPRISGSLEKFHRIPATITFRQVSERKNEEDKSGFQAEVSGRGTLDEEGKKHVEFLFRVPDAREKSNLGERDKYFFGYWTEDRALYLGDRSYSLSPLTENNLYGRGIEGNMKIDSLNLEAWHMKTLWLDPEKEQTAFHFDYLFRDRHRMGLNLLKKKAVLKTLRS